MKTDTKMQIAHVAIDELKPDPANPRRIGDAEMEALTRSLNEYGFVQPVLARAADKTVIGGHQRLLAARKLGIKTVPVIFLDLTVEQSRVLNLALNKISGSWDEELLARMVADLSDVDDLDISLSGFSEDELDALLKSLDLREKKDKPESFDVDAALEAARAATRAKPGDLWALGDHRLLVGDAGDTAAVLTGVLDAVIVRNRCALIGAHHDRKKPPLTKRDSGTDRIRGSTALAGWLSFCLSIEKDTKIPDRLNAEWTKVRDAEDGLSDLTLDFDRETINYAASERKAASKVSEAPGPSRRTGSRRYRRRRVGRGRPPVPRRTVCRRGAKSR